MASSVRLFRPPHRQLYLSHSRIFKASQFSSNTHRPINLFFNPKPPSNSNLHFSISIPSHLPPNSLTSLTHFNLSISGHHFARIFSNPNQNLFKWHYSSHSDKGLQNGLSFKEAPEVTAVLLGWLGAKPKHLRRYVELYNSKGIHAVTFVASVRDVLSFDLGRRLEERISHLADELARWLSESHPDGRERVLVFHTFSNTGWLAYGAILENLRGRQHLLEKIKGCVVDSGGDPNIDPKVWAAGFTAALLKKQSFSAYPSPNAGERDGIDPGEVLSKEQENEPHLIEKLLLSAFEKLFSYLLGLPDINQRLKKVIRALKNQRPCPQLYLYSTADKVIPYQSVESFIEEQKSCGREVSSHNFVSSPHVDHYRTFSNVYVSELEKFLEKCVSVEKTCKPAKADTN